MGSAALQTGQLGLQLEKSRDRKRTVLVWLICLKCLSCVYMFGAKCIFAFLHHAHTPVQIVYVHANRKVIDTMYGGNKKKKAVLPLPCPLKNRFREIFIRFCHPT